MKKNIILLGALMLSSFAYSQVGINNEAPKATLDVTAKTTDGTKPEGIIAPRLSGDQIKLADTQFGTPQTGTIAYATSASSDAGIAATKTINITAAGYYYFDGAIWQKFSGAAAAGTNDWHITGNNDIDANVNFLGTTTDTDLVFKRNNTQSGWISPVSQQNTSFGTLALQRSNVIAGGAFNGAIGYGALSNLTSGNRNQAMGNYALNLLTTGVRNIGIGNGAGRTIVSTGNNTAVGHFSLENSTPLDGNTAIGSSALRYSSGSNNIALGFNTAIGTSGAPISGSNNIAIGANQTLADLTASNQLNIGGAIFGTGLSGSAATPAGFIGIGTAAPSNTLHVKATTDPLKLEGLTAGVATDDVLVANSAGVVKKVPASTFGGAEVDGIIGNEVTGITAGGGNSTVLAIAGAGTTASPLTVGMTPSATVGQVLTTTAAGTVGWATPSTTTYNVTTEQTGSYTVLATDDFVKANINVAGQTITLPTTGIPVGRKVTISNIGTANVAISPLPYNASFNSGVDAGNNATYVYLGGTGTGSWDRLSGY